ncbi:MAG: hypothetical protein NTX49_07140 [Chlamydiae bacterium]|nr:hypothetical protein [Chlamydiota bacterium]
MSNTLSELHSLLSDTLDYISDEYKEKKSLLTSPESYEFFASFKKVAKEPAPPAQAPFTPIAKLPSNLVPSNPVPEKLAPVKPASFPKKEEPLPLVNKSAPSAQAAVKISTTLDFSEEMKKQVMKILPSITILRDIPSDEDAIILSEAWKQPTKQADVLLFSFSESPETDRFLTNIKKAIEAHFCSCSILDAKVWEEKKEWTPFFTIHKPKLIIGSPEIFKTKQLLGFYKENTASKERFLHEHPFMLLLSLSQYLKFPEQKKDLWNNLCNLLKKTP